MEPRPHYAARRTQRIEGAIAMLEDLARRAHHRLGLLRLSAEARAVVNDRLTYLSPRKLARFERTVGKIVADDVAGDLLEFGVALGGTSILLARHASADRVFHGFDVFGMIPPPTEKDGTRVTERYATIREGRSTGIDGDPYYGYQEDLIGQVRANLARHGLQPSDNIQLHKGLFEESWPLVPVRAVGFAHIDCDWHDPVAYCLDAVGDLVSPGGAILIDDYHDYEGAKAAVDAFLKTRDDFSFEPGRNPVLWKKAAR